MFESGSPLFVTINTAVLVQNSKVNKFYCNFQTSIIILNKFYNFKEIILKLIILLLISSMKYVVSTRVLLFVFVLFLFIHLLGTQLRAHSLSLCWRCCHAPLLLGYWNGQDYFDYGCAVRWKTLLFTSFCRKCHQDDVGLYRVCSEIKLLGRLLNRKAGKGHMHEHTHKATHLGYAESYFRSVLLVCTIASCLR